MADDRWPGSGGWAAGRRGRTSGRACGAGAEGGGPGTGRTPLLTWAAGTTCCITGDLKLGTGRPDGSRDREVVAGLLLGKVTQGFYVVC